MESFGGTFVRFFFEISCLKRNFGWKFVRNTFMSVTKRERFGENRFVYKDIRKFSTKIYGFFIPDIRSIKSKIHRVSIRGIFLTRLIITLGNSAGPLWKSARSWRQFSAPGLVIRLRDFRRPGVAATLADRLIGTEAVVRWFHELTRKRFRPAERRDSRSVAQMGCDRWRGAGADVGVDEGGPARRGATRRCGEVLILWSTKLRDGGFEVHAMVPWFRG